MNNDFIIRRYREMDQEKIIAIWYKESLNAHCFIPAQFWDGHLESLKSKYLPQAETFVAEKEGNIVGFISMIGNYVGALFVDGKHHKQGIGTGLLHFVHKAQGGLFVDVYQKNDLAREFYLKFGFKHRREKVQPETGEVLLTLFKK